MHTSHSKCASVLFGMVWFGFVHPLLRSLLCSRFCLFHGLCCHCCCCWLRCMSPLRIYINKCAISSLAILLFLDYFFIICCIFFCCASDHKMQCHKRHTTKSKTFKNQPKTNQQCHKNSNNNNNKSDEDNDDDDDDDTEFIYSGVFFQLML